jgi:hypothetical protein
MSWSLGSRLRQEPSAGGVGREELHDGQEVHIGPALLGRLLPDAAVAQELFEDG